MYGVIEKEIWSIWICVIGGIIIYFVEFVDNIRLACLVFSLDFSCSAASN